jgi:D-alanyl-D-alanine carboxypeptidase (penicillin-binding protein 5/6)
VHVRRAAAVVAALGATLAVTGGALVGAVPARRAVIPPPAPVGPSGSRSQFPTTLHTPGDATVPPGLGSVEALLEDLGTGQVLVAKDARRVRPVASLTKVMTALLVLERLPLSSIVSVSPRAVEEPGAKLGLRVGERVDARSLLYALLLASADDAAVALAERVAGSAPAFVALMNRRAAQLGMRHTRFASPDGFDNAGVSSPLDLAVLTRTAMGDPVFEAIVGTKRATVASRTGPTRIVQNRNVLLWLYRGAVGVKTGFTTPARHCLITVAQRGGTRLLVVILGAPTERQAFDDGAALLNYGFEGLRTVTVVSARQALGTLTAGDEEITVVAGTPLTALVPVGEVDRVRLILRQAPGLRRPIRRGSTVGTLTARAGRLRLGSVPAVAAAVRTASHPATRRASPALAPIATAIEVLRAFTGSVFDGFL